MEAQVYINTVHYRALIPLCMLKLKTMAEKAAELRRQILELSARYINETRSQAGFEPGQSSVPVSGKVIDGSDVSAIVDAALDAWFTTGRFAEDFERKLARFLGLRS